MKLLLQISLIFVLSYSSLLGYSDFDLDGVDDSVDKCPNTAITDLVNMDGCSIVSLKSPHSFALSIAQKYYDTQESFFTTELTFDYFYKEYSIEFKTAYLSLNTTLSDSYLFGYHTLYLLPKLKLQYGLGIALPTQDSSNTTNNNIDFLTTLYFTYTLQNYTLFSGYSYSFINDTDSYLDYQNNYTFVLGGGFYPQEKLYTNIAYSFSSNVIKSQDTLSNITICMSYFLKEDYSISSGFEKSLNGDDFGVNMKIGYYF